VRLNPDGSAVPWNSNLHPRVGGKFAPKGTGTTASSRPAGSGSGSKGAKGKKTAAGNGLGYSASQWGQLQKLEKIAQSGGKLDAHQKHMLHQAHEKHLAAIGQAPKAAAKPKAKAKPKKAAPKPAAKPRTPPRTTMTPARLKART
jgi:hypothetical protein